jgi:hypothetical protein
MSPELATQALMELQPWMEKHGTIAAGGFPAYLIAPSEQAIPGDLDMLCRSIWLDRAQLAEIGWVLASQYDVPDDRTLTRMSPDISKILNFVNLKYPFNLQLLVTRTSNFKEVLSRFDFDVCMATWIPFRNAAGDIIGLRGNTPALVEKIQARTTSYMEHEWDITADGKLDVRGISRLLKYKRKGYTIIAHSECKFTTEQLEEYINAPLPATVASENASYYSKFKYPEDSVARFEAIMNELSYDHSLRIDRDVFTQWYTFGGQYQRDVTFEMDRKFWSRELFQTQRRIDANAKLQAERAKKDEEDAAEMKKIVAAFGAGV